MNSPKICLIAAFSENHVLAKNGKIPWKIPTDYKRYRKIIKRHIIIAGRKTFDMSYTDTVNIVITHEPAYKPPLPAVVVHSIAEALALAKSEKMLAQTPYKDEIFIIGGGEVFKETIPFADKLYLTLIHKVIYGDTFFPDYANFQKVTFKEDRKENGYSFTFLNMQQV